MNAKRWALVVITIVIWVAVLAIALASPDKAGAQSCYVIMYTEAMRGDTWLSIATHWGMTTATLKAMNRDVIQKRGQPVLESMLKIAVWAGCPSW
jgi:hypothetical protein